MTARNAFAVALSLAVVVTSPVAAQAPPPPPASPTLWSFLGIPQAGYKIHAQLFNRRGNHPALEKKPPLKGIADPANLKSDVPAIKAAAEIKQAEDLAPQKIKAIKYLATIGCGCYDKDEKVTAALLAAMDDCTEDVRLAAVEAITTAASGEYCSQCKERSCCNEKIVAQLSKIAYERDDEGCFVEPSERVREAAIEAMGICCAGQAGPIAPPVPTPIEGGERPLPLEGGPRPIPDNSDAPPVPPQPPALIDDAGGPAASRTTASRKRMQLTSSRRVPPAAPLPPVIRPGKRQEESVLARPVAESRPTHDNRSEEHVAPVFKKITGTVSQVSPQAGLVQLCLAEGEVLPPGATVKVHHEFLSGTSVVAVLKVIDSRPGEANARPVTSGRFPKIARGDFCEAWR